LRKLQPIDVSQGGFVVLKREEKLRCCLFGLIQNRIVRPSNDLPEGPSRETIV
jgi:hypothetical protein